MGAEVGLVSEKSAASTVVPSVEDPRRARTGFRGRRGGRPGRGNGLGSIDERSAGVKMEILGDM